MTLKLKNQDLTLSIPVLTDEKNFKLWNESFLRYLGSLKLKHYVKYDVAEAFLLNDQAVDHQECATILNSANFDATSDAEATKKLSAELRQEILQNLNNSFMFKKSKPRLIPSDLIALVKSFDLLAIGNKIIPICESGEKYIDRLDSHASHVDKIMTILYDDI